MTTFEPLINGQQLRSEVTLELYRKEHKPLWDKFVTESKNGLFLYYRDYMEYHKDRFTDHSLIFYKEKQPVALLPANIEDGTLYSHGGLTFGGLISGINMSQTLMLSIFQQLIEHCKQTGIHEVRYKPVPHIYHMYPAEEDLYALKLNHAELVLRSPSSAIYLPNKRAIAKHQRKRNIQRAQKENITIKQSFDFENFMQISQEILKNRHESKPVHSTREIEYLATKFPQNIKLFAAYKETEMLAGLVVYEYKHVAHAQYAANTDSGWECGAEDAIINYLINDYYKNSEYIDFGISTEKVGQVLLDNVLNEGLINYKESFGASSIVYDCYQLKI